MISPLPFTFCPQLLVRTPAQPFSDFCPEKLENILRDHDFQKAILLASGELYAELSKRDFDYRLLDFRLRLAAFKYYNRMSYRPTPFGTFASVGLLPWGNTGAAPVRSSGNRLLSFREFQELMKGKGGFSAQSLFYPNPSLFSLGDRYRYFSRHSIPGERDSFLVMELDKTRMMKNLLSFLKAPAGCAALLEFLEAELDGINPAEELSELVSTQVLYHTDLPVLTRRQFPLIEVPASPGDRCYTIAYHNHKGSFNERCQQDILEGLSALDKFSAVRPVGGLSRFAAQFSERFGEAEVPLLRAIDPQAGISYSGNERTAGQNGSGQQPFVGGSGIPDAGQEAARALILQKLANFDRCAADHIQLSEAEISALPGRTSNGYLYPPSIPVVFRLAGASVFIENAGGCSAVSIAGRFSHDPKILETLREITATEQRRNPAVVFAELAAADNHPTDNISTRAHLRDYEIPVLVGSELPDARIIPLNDLCIRVTGGKVLLRSARLDKQVIPRLSSAYNYRLSNLPLLHFLADLQYQGLNYDFSWDLERLIPGLNFYPRVAYKNCMLSAASWIWDEQQLTMFEDRNNGMDNFLHHARLQKLSRFFTLSSGDRELVFDLESPLSLEYFLQTIRGSRRAVLKEYFFADDGRTLKDERGHKYSAQMVAFLVSSTPAYQGMNTAVTPLIRSKPKRFLPGSDWLYFKIYGHRESLNELLRDPGLMKIINGFGDLDGISCWFFVRYADPNDHIRLRLQVKENFSDVITRQISAMLEAYMENHLITAVSLDVYEPELQRYGRAGIGRVEKIFQRSSEAVLAFQLPEGNQLLESFFALSSADSMLKAFLPNMADRADFVWAACNGIFPDNLRIRLDQFYRRHRAALEHSLADAPADDQMAAADKVTRLAKKCARLQQVLQKKGRPADPLLIADLLHMHLNRLNASGAKDLDSSTYYLLGKYYRSVLARKADRSVAPASPADGFEGLGA